MKISRFVAAFFALAFSFKAEAKVDYHLTYQEGTSNVFAVALPPTDQIQTASDAVAFLEGSQDPNSHSKIHALVQWDTKHQSNAVYAYFEQEHAWRGNNFKLEPLKPVWVFLVPGADFQFSVNLQNTQLSLDDEKAKLPSNKGRVWLVWPEIANGKASKVLEGAGGEAGAVGKYLPSSGKHFIFRGEANKDFSLTPGKAYFIEFNY